MIWNYENIEKRYGKTNKPEMIEITRGYDNYNVADGYYCITPMIDVYIEQVSYGCTHYQKTMNKNIINIDFYLPWLPTDIVWDTWGKVSVKIHMPWILKECEVE